jgi:hypothetical protein
MLAASVAGTIPTWILVAMALFVAWRVSRGGAGSAVSELTAANHVLEQALTRDRDKFGAEIRDLRIENGELRGRTDVAIALMPVIEWTTVHEKRAQERHDATIVVLGLIAKRLGPEPNGEHPE